MSQASDVNEEYSNWQASFATPRGVQGQLIFWFLAFALGPLLIVTGYSLVQYRKGINHEIRQRLEANSREIKVILDELHSQLKVHVERSVREPALSFAIVGGRPGDLVSLAIQSMKTHIAQEYNIFRGDGRLEVALYRDASGEIKRLESVERRTYLAEKFLERVGGQSIAMVADTRGTASMDLIAFGVVKGRAGQTLGYIEEIIRIDEGFLSGISKRLNLQSVLLSKDSKQAVTLNDDLSLYDYAFYENLISGSPSGFFDLPIEGVEYGFLATPIAWGESQFVWLLGTSKAASQVIMERINFAFMVIVGSIIFIVVILSVLISRRIIRPLADLMAGLERMKLSPHSPVEIPVDSKNELGVLAEAFNLMSQQVVSAQETLQEKVKELEAANQEIRSTQAQLVHSAKMASLGQLVAGVAHELNNPIGFIYSNMTTLRDYTERLISLVNGPMDAQTLADKKQELDLDYIAQDLPRLISSCEDGARRTRDIVIGLRSFSRAADQVSDEVHINDGIMATLRLLKTELKDHIEVELLLGDIPAVPGIASQLNQVFMNVISNAAQAMPSAGKLQIKTYVEANYVVVDVSDTGCGVNEDDASRIFDPFYTTKAIGEGTGLGLSISHGIIKAHHGRIEVVFPPVLGDGSTFRICLPFEGPKAGGQ